MPSFLTSKLSSWIAPVSSIVLLIYLYQDSLAYLFLSWSDNENYSYGIFVPFISLYLIWLNRHRIMSTGMQGSWWGIVIVFTGLVLYAVGELATLYVVLHLSFWLVIVGLVISAVGLRATSAISFPLLYLLTSIPLPIFLYQELSGQLQLLSSALGVGGLQLLGVVAFREGNVIDLGPIQLQVVDACSGIRYLFPLISLALLCAYCFKDRMWKRVVIVLSSIPISVLVNGFRIGMIGVLVEYYGEGAAQGFYHFFEGWLLFMASLFLLFSLMWVLAKVPSPNLSRTFLEKFRIAGNSFDPNPASSIPGQAIASPRPAFAWSVALLVPVVFASAGIVGHEELRPARAAFVDFPMTVGAWQGTPVALEQRYLEVLRVDDYLLADYWSSVGEPINLYAAYYGSQKKGQSAHSPKSCIPGGGWEIASLRRVELQRASPHEAPFTVNRVLIQKDKEKQLVFYWFKQRDRVLSNEYLVKLFLLWDALTKRRTDGALVRLVSSILPGETEAVVDSRLTEFARLTESELIRYVPD